MNIELAWTAGILEGEGYFSRTGITVEMTDLDVVQKLQSLWGGNLYYPKDRDPKWKTSYKWHLNISQSFKLMILIRDLMGVRRRARIDELIKFKMDQDERSLIRKEIGRMAGFAYIKGEGSLRQLQKRFGVSYETIRKYAAVV